MDANWFALILVILAFGECPRLQKPWNGRVIGSCNGLVGAQCVFACREPYVLVGSSARVCREDGSWSGTNTACELNGCDNCCTDCGDRGCPGLPDPDNGYAEGQCSQGVVGQSCLFRCNHGYALEGQSRLTCLSGGVWNAPAPWCRRNSVFMCESLTIRHGYARCALEGGLTVCRVRCHDGYVLVGSTVITCTPTGVWSEQIPDCRRTVTEVTALCPSLTAPPGGRLLGSCRSAGSGDTCQLVCLSGYRPTDTRVLVCQPNGLWSNDLPRCVGSDCPSIVVPQAITSGTCNPGRAGQSCTVTCQSGNTLAGSSTLVCLSTGEWSGTIPTCSAVPVRSCPPLPPPASGGTSGTCSPGLVGQSCSFFCSTGYSLVGDSTLICGSDGQWSGSIPYCAGQGCLSLSPPANGEYSGQCVQALAGQTCTFSCHAGYTLSGIATLYCQPDGQWSSLPPACIRSTYSTNCPSLVAPSRGILIGVCSPGRVGETCAFACDEGYELVGQRTLTCLPDGRWSSSLPYCQREQGGNGENCPPLYPPPNGELVECDNRPGGRCVVVCEHGYLRSGSRVRTCLQNGVWSGFAPTCTRKVGYTYKYKVVPLWSLVFG
ncbi:P-selectin-like [Uloborus diversus]|uniref:P-selectin-like n=1 Tax=Uloborus diversus TaxID=327109 RepID=UPI002409D422|nr:P-selectin-like [Uloborus diversus]